MLFAGVIFASGTTFAHYGLLQVASNELPTTVVAASATISPTTVISPTTRFAPNYATDLLNLRRWKKDKIAIYVDQPAAAQNPIRRNYSLSVHTGAELWSPYLGDTVGVVFTENPANADVRVSFVNKGSLPDGAIGRTEVTYRNRDNVIVAATVRLDRTLQPELLAQVAAHELGHAFGLEGHSVNKTDLMYARAHLPGIITTRDSNTLHLNYSLDATRANARPAAQVAPQSVASWSKSGTTTTAACSLPEETP